MTNNEPRGRGGSSRRGEFGRRGVEGGACDALSVQTRATPSKFASKWQLISVRMNGPAPLICHFAPRQFVCDCQHRPVPPSYTQIYICIYEFAYTKKASDSRPLDCSPVEILDLYETSRRRWRVKFRGKLLFLYTWKGVRRLDPMYIFGTRAGQVCPRKLGRCCVEKY